jgi:transposase
VLYEFGIVLPKGHRALLKKLPAALPLASDRLPEMQVQLREQIKRIIGALEQRLSHQLPETPACKSLGEMPGIGLMTATAVVAGMGSPAVYRDGREFAASIGLAPQQTGTGGRVRELGISKRGEAYLRRSSCMEPAPSSARLMRPRGHGSPSFSSAHRSGRS